MKSFINQNTQSSEFIKKKRKKMTLAEDTKYDKEHGIKEHSAEDQKMDREHGVKDKKACKVCGKRGHKSGDHKKKGGLKLNPPSKGHAPKGAHGRAAVHALGRTKTTGNFAKIEASEGKGAAINAYQNALKAHQSGAKSKKGGKEMLKRAMKKLNH